MQWRGALGVQQPPSLRIESLEDLETFLGISATAEAELRCMTQAAVLNERRHWLEGTRSVAWLGRKWREFNAIDATSYGRLHGIPAGNIRRAMRDGMPFVVAPFSGKPLIPMWMPLAEGFSHEEIRQAVRGENVHLARLVRTVVDSYS